MEIYNDNSKPLEELNKKRLEVFRSLDSNMLNDAKTKDVIDRTMDLVYEAVSTTLGPYGSNVIISDSRLQHYCTKDGYTVLRNMAVDGFLSRVILNFLQRVSSKLNRTVGDGTTSAIVLARNLYKSLEILKSRIFLTPKNFSRILNNVAKDIEEELKKSAYNPSKEDKEVWSKILYNVAYTSSNGDADVASKIIEAYDNVSFNGNITVEEAVSTGVIEDSIIYNSGFELYCGCDIDTFQTDFERQQFSVSGDVFVFISKIPLIADYMNKFSNILQYINQKESALVIIAPSYDTSFVDFFRINKQQLADKLMICPVAYPTDKAEQLELIDDLRLFLGIGKENIFGSYDLDDCSFDNFMARNGGMQFLGKCDSVTITQNKALFIGCNQKSGEYSNLLEKKNKIDAKISDLMTNDNYLNHSEEIGKLRKRLCNLSNKSTAKIIVGGKTPQEIHTRYYLVEDAVYACKSSLRFGVGIGCNYTLYRAVNTIFSQACEKIGSILPEAAIKKVVDRLLFKTRNNPNKVEPDKDSTTIKNDNNSVNGTIFDGFLEVTDDLCYLEIIIGIVIAVINSVAKLIERSPKYEPMKEIRIVDYFGKNVAFNLVNEKPFDVDDNYDYSYGPINSIETDIEILRTAISIIGLILSSRNFICVESLMDNTDSKITNQSFIRK